MLNPSKENGKGQAPKKGTPPEASSNKRPAKFTYVLKAYTAERRGNGWYVTVSVPALFDVKQDWCGPFETIENACLAIARRHAVEIADRHTRSLEFHKIKRGDGLYGFKPTTKLNAR